MRLSFVLACGLLLLTSIASSARAQPVSLPQGPYHKVDCGNSLLSVLSGCLLNATGQETFCISNVGWQSVPCKGSDGPQTVKTEFYKAWLEYNEDGSAADPKQRDAVIARLQDLHERGEPVLIVTYVHGWHHNADPNDNNVQKFSELLARYSDSLRRKFLQTNVSDKPVVFGIYVGWRGEEFLPEVGIGAYLWTIKSRSRVADTIGHAGFLKNDLQKISDEMLDTDRMVVIGHSLGGRMLTSAFIKDFPKNSRPLGRNTWIVTINAAVSADCYDDVFKRTSSTTSSSAPTWLNWTNEDDDATGIDYNAGHFVRAVEACKERNAAGTTAIGHYTPYLTHDISFEYLDNKRCAESGCMDILRGCIDGSEHCSASADWFKGSPRDSLIVYLRRDPSTYEKEDSVLYRVAFGYYRGERRLFDNEDGYYSGHNRLRRRNVSPLWNIHTDSTAIDIPGSPSAGSPKHNGYVSTNMTRLLVELMYNQ